jgi:esterase
MTMCTLWFIAFFSLCLPCRTLYTTNAISTSSTAVSSAKILYHSCLLSNHHQPHTQPIVILHGLLGSMRNFQSWARILLKQTNNEYDIICMDLRNHGRSSLYGPLDCCYDSMAEDVLLTLHRLSIKKCHLIGHSMGAKVAAAAVLRDDNSCIQSLTMMDISPVPYTPIDFENVIYCVNTLADLAIVMESNSLSKTELVKFVSQAFDDPSLQQFILSNAQQHGNSFKWSFHIHSLAKCIENIMDFKLKQSRQPCNTPTMILKGSKSDFVKSSHLPAISNLFPHYTLATIRDAGHWLHFERPEQSASKVADFIKYVQQIL